MARPSQVILTNMCLVENDQGQFVMQIRSPDRRYHYLFAQVMGFVLLRKDHYDARLYFLYPLKSWT